MSMSKTIRKAYSEVDQFINLLDRDIREKIPENIRRLFNEEKDKEYTKKVTSNIPIKEQNLMEETLAIIAYLNLEFICQDEKEKQRLREVYKKNEAKYQEVFQIGFDSNSIFRKEETHTEQKEETTTKQLVNINEGSIIVAMFRKIKSFFRR